MPEFNPHSRVVDVVETGAAGREALNRHGYLLGDGFVDVLSQFQSLEEAAREGRLRDLDGLLHELNSTAP